jgi:hypothetical protein
LGHVIRAGSGMAFGDNYLTTTTPAIIAQLENELRED